MKPQSLTLVPMTLDDVYAMIEAMSPDEKAQLSADWMAQLHASTAPDPWKHGFSIVVGETGVTVGKCMFKGPPSEEGMVEIAYGIDPEHQGKGYATGAAAALVEFAFNHPSVRCVRAHTLPTSGASARVLTKCGFRHLGEVIDPDDGLVWRWEKYLA